MKAVANQVAALEGRVWGAVSPSSTMSTSSARNSQTNAPFALQRRRTLMACSNCRRRKMRCITTEQPPTNPCARCTKKGLPCEYVAVDQDDEPAMSQSPELGSSALPESGGHSRRPSMQGPAWAAQPSASTNNSSRGFGSAPPPPLPYTGPPPPNRRPRYAGSSQYPDLSLSGSGQPTPSAPYYPSQASNPMANQGYNNPQAAQPYPYMANPAQQPGMYPPGNNGYPQNYGQMPYYGGGPMPEYGWPPATGFEGPSQSWLLVPYFWHAGSCAWTNVSNCHVHL
ncbi:C6 finger domain [Mycena venus]|uniref:C6 finger domain n=1 Tax=Mycena venus TaxID=2733690 RepID=A0A8H6Z0Y3_9AGAR|nr:C6 finger domain [Mycena venus]